MNGKRKRNTYIDQAFLETVTKELDDARYALDAVMSSPRDDKWYALASAAMGKVHNVIVWAIHQPPFHEVHARNWREWHALEQGEQRREGEGA